MEEEKKCATEREAGNSAGEREENLITKVQAFVGSSVGSIRAPVFQ